MGIESDEFCSRSSSFLSSIYISVESSNLTNYLLLFLCPRSTEVQHIASLPLIPVLEMPQTFHTEIEISRPPAEVRKVVRPNPITPDVVPFTKTCQFLDFPKMPEWHQGFTITHLAADSKTEVEVGDKLKNIADGITLYPIVQVRLPASHFPTLILSD